MSLIVTSGSNHHRYKARSIQIIRCVIIHPACDIRQGTFHTTADNDHPHGSFVGQYCQGQAQEITVEVILCKYSRQCGRAKPRRHHLSMRRGAVSIDLGEVSKVLIVVSTVTPKGVQPPALCHASATRESP